MISGEAIHAALRPGEKTETIFTIQNSSNTRAKSAIELKNLQTTTPELLQKFSVSIVTQDETQTLVYPSTSLQTFIDRGYTILEILEPYAIKHYRITFSSEPEISHELQDTSITFDLLVGMEAPQEKALMKVVLSSPTPLPSPNAVLGTQSAQLEQTSVPTNAMPNKETPFPYLALFSLPIMIVLFVALCILLKRRS